MSGPKVSFMMSSSGGSGSGSGDDPKRKKNPTPVTVQVTTGLGHKAVSVPEKKPREDGSVPTVEAIDWGKQPAIPATKIDWQGQGEPLRVRPTLGTLIAILVGAASVLGAGAMFYWGVQSHVSDKAIHLKSNGTLPDLLSERYETRNEARVARTKLGAEVGVKVEKVGKRVNQLDTQLKTVSAGQQKILREIRKTRRAVTP
jgi:hypothetical protein